MIIKTESSLEKFQALKERLEQESPNSDSTDEDEIVAEINFTDNQFLNGDAESSSEFLDQLEGTYRDSVTVRREWSVDRSGQEAGVSFQNKNSGCVKSEVPVNFKIGFDSKSSVLGFKKTLSEEYKVPNLVYKSQGQSSSVSKAIEEFKNSERLSLYSNNFSVALQENQENWSVVGLDFEYNFMDRTVDPEKLKIPYRDIIEDVKEAAKENGIEYTEEVFEAAAEDHEEYVGWATKNNSNYDAEEILSAGETQKSGGFLDRIT